MRKGIDERRYRDRWTGRWRWPRESTSPSLEMIPSVYRCPSEGATGSALTAENSCSWVKDVVFLLDALGSFGFGISATLAMFHWIGRHPAFIGLNLVLCHLLSTFYVMYCFLIVQLSLALPPPLCRAILFLQKVRLSLSLILTYFPNLSFFRTTAIRTVHIKPSTLIQLNEVRFFWGPSTFLQFCSLCGTLT